MVEKLSQRDYLSWGRLSFEPPRAILPLLWSSDNPFRQAQNYAPVAPSWLVYAQGRSYGDVCLNSGQGLIETRHCNRVLSFDPATGLLEAEAGITMREILEFAIPRGWFLPVTPGTMEVSLGGAIANDVHGKNHHQSGTIGRHIPSFMLLRSDESHLLCSPETHPEFYKATIGGLGLTGIITSAQIELKKARCWIDAEMIKFRGLDEFEGLAIESDDRYEYTVAWIDCVDAIDGWGRGIFFRGNHTPANLAPESIWKTQLIRPSVPIEMPSWLLNRWTVKAFNLVYYHKQLPSRLKQMVYFKPFFYPLDGVQKWNKIYGAGGLFQFQFVIPLREQAALHDIFSTLAKTGQASFLAVLKKFGNLPSPGYLSFPKEGYTLTLDFPNRGQSTIALLNRLTAIVEAAQGRLYPAKDAHMSAEFFSQSYSDHLMDFYKCLDPFMNSNFWRRVRPK